MGFYWRTLSSDFSISFACHIKRCAFVFNDIIKIYPRATVLSLPSEAPDSPRRLLLLLFPKKKNRRKIDDVFVLRLIWVQIYVYEKCFLHIRKTNLWLCALIILNIVLLVSSLSLLRVHRLEIMAKILQHFILSFPIAAEVIAAAAYFF